MKKSLFIAGALFSALSSYGQWATAPDGEITLFPEFLPYLQTEMSVSTNGDTWFEFNRMGKDTEGNTAEIYYCQGLDAKGMPIMGAEPAMLSNFPYQTYVMVNHNLFTDREGNAIMAVQDNRGAMGYHGTTVYKVSPSGEQLWGEDGVLVSGDIVSDLLCSFMGTQLSDGSYIMTWMNTNPEIGGKMEINIVRVLADGTLAWTPGSVRLSNEKTEFYYPMVVDAGNGQFILVYAEGGNFTVKAMKYDFDGTPVWGEPTEIYNGGWGSTPMWTKCGIAPSGDNGVLFFWYDDRNMTNFEDPYLAYVKPNGELGFNVSNGLKLDYQNYTRNLGIKCVYDPGTDSFVAIFLSADGDQHYYEVKAQRVSKTGELLWGEEAKIVGDMVEGRYGYINLVCGEPGRVAFFYEKREGLTDPATDNVCDYYDVEDCAPLWDEALVFGTPETPKSNLLADTSGRFWVASWLTNPVNENGYAVSGEANISVQRINFDGTVGAQEMGLQSVEATSPLGLAIDGNRVNFEEETTVYDVNGRRMFRGTSATLAPGFYMGVGDGHSAKFIIR